VLVVQNNVDGVGHVHVTETASARVEIDATARNVRAGAVVPVRGTVDCNGARGPTTVPVELTFVDAADSVRVVVSYDVTVRCAGSPDHAAGGTGDPAGNVTTNATTTTT
jgi:hypothetical protein